jgi:two-component system CAI-1 autoinducer sensor kinase/phosphatase CqsS
MPVAYWMRYKHRLQAWTNSEVVKPLLEPIVEPILHPSRWRIQALGLSTAIGHPLFYGVWTWWLPQPYERWWQRLLMGGLGTCLVVVPQLTASPPSRGAALVFSGIFWITLPVFFTWMYFANGASAIWLASLGAMFLIYYHLTDWRIATVGITTGLPTGWLLFLLFGPQVPPMAAQEWAAHGVVFSFCWYMGLMLGLSSSNLRREQIKQALGTMGIMAHELRTPLATMALIGDAIRNEAQAAADSGANALTPLVNRLHTSVRNMNRLIDMQISNAQFMHLPAPREPVDAGTLVREAVAAFPYRNERERACVEVIVREDFAFRSSAQLFSQVIDNLMKNALRSLAATPRTRSLGDLRLEVDVVNGKGRISVADRGAGMSENVRVRIFQPFVSSHGGTGHGLGLAFCQRVVHHARGSISVESSPDQGARFIIELPSLAVPEATSPSNK